MICALLLLCAACSDYASTSGLDELTAAESDYANGCTWRRADFVDFVPPDDRCYDLYTGPESRISDQRLGTPCNAEDLPQLFLYRPGAEMVPYFDHDLAPAFRLQRSKWEYCD